LVVVIALSTQSHVEGTGHVTARLLSTRNLYRESHCRRVSL
jgi:hypothetical protein